MRRPRLGRRADAIFKACADCQLHPLESYVLPMPVLTVKQLLPVRLRACARISIQSAGTPRAQARAKLVPARSDTDVVSDVSVRGWSVDVGAVSGGAL
eukprot:994729-Prymnesium_polylepis.1